MVAALAVVELAMNGGTVGHVIQQAPILPEIMMDRHSALLSWLFLCTYCFLDQSHYRACCSL